MKNTNQNFISVKYLQIYEEIKKNSEEYTNLLHDMKQVQQIMIEEYSKKYNVEQNTVYTVISLIITDDILKNKKLDSVTFTKIEEYLQNLVSKNKEISQEKTSEEKEDNNLVFLNKNLN